MAETKTEKPKVETPKEKIYTIPLSKYYKNKQRAFKANRAVNTVKAYLFKHEKPVSVLISPGINQEIWKRGAKKPPSMIKIKVKKDDKGGVRASMPDEKFDAVVEEKRGLKDKLLGRGKKETDLSAEEKAEFDKFRETGELGGKTEEAKPAEEKKEDKSAGEKKTEEKKTKEPKEEELSEDEKKIIEEAEKEVAKEKK